jgi:hypothetical protein
MQEYKIDVTQIEALQNTSNTNALDKIFTRAKSTIVNGEKVVLERREANGRTEKFDELTTLEALDEYKRSVYKYL